MSTYNERAEIWGPLWDQIFSIDDSEEEEEEKDVISPLEKRSETAFITDSKYDGEWNNVTGTIEGNGQYTFPHKVGFRGTFEDGQFKDGVYYYPNGDEVDGFVEHRMVRLADGFIFYEGSDYCTPMDRRYWSTIVHGFRPAGHERLTGGTVDRPIPEGCYDTVDGFYDPSIKCVISAFDHSTILRIPTKSESDWIVRNCRKAWDEAVGYRPDLYEKWTTGINDYLENNNHDDIISLEVSMRTNTVLHNVNDGSSFNTPSHSNPSMDIDIGG